MGYNINTTQMISPNTNASIELLFNMVRRAYNRALLKNAFNTLKRNVRR